MILLTIEYQVKGKPGVVTEPFEFDNTQYRVAENNFLNVLSDHLSAKLGGIDKFTLLSAIKKTKQ